MRLNVASTVLRSLLLIGLLPVSLFADFSLSGQLPAEFAQGTVVLEREWHEERSTETVAQAALEQGRFQLQTNEQPGLFRLRIGEVQVPFVAGEGDRLQVIATGGKLSISGGAHQDLFLAYEKVRAESLGRLVLNVREAIRAARAAGNEAKAERLTEDEVTGYQAHRRELNDFTLAQLKGSPALYAAALRWDGDHRLPELAAMVRSFSAENPSLEISKRMTSRVERFEATAIGAVAPDLAGPAPDGSPVSLASLRGRYVLVDFWASWCPPCRTENRHYVNLYSKYRDRGFEILAVSVDQNGTAWKSAITADKATWKHLSDLTGWKTPLAAKYNVSALPASYLLDPEGRIIAKDARGERLSALLATHLGGAATTQR